MFSRMVNISGVRKMVNLMEMGHLSIPMDQRLRVHITMESGTEKGQSLLLMAASM